MGLLAPWFLGGLVAIGLPVYLHLLRRHRIAPVPFASLMFFERRVQSSIQHRRLQYLLLLALRVAVIALLMLAFARPYWRSSAAAATEDRVVALCLDDSFSMRQGDRMGQAKRDALTTIDALHLGDRAQVIASGGQGSRVLTGITGDHAVLRAAVESVQAGDGAGAFAEVARALNSLSESSHRAIQAHFFSDMQKTALPASFHDLQLKPGIALQLHAVGREVPNFTVETVRAPARITDPKRTRIVATVAGYHTPASRQRVSLLINGKTLAEKTADVPADGRAAVEFTGLDIPYGLNRGEVRLNASDAFPDDDHHYFSMTREDPRPVLFVHDASDTRSLLFFQNALEAGGGALFRMEALTTEQGAARDLSRYAFVVLSDTGRLPAAFESALEHYVRNGGAVLAVLGTRSTPGAKTPVAGLTIIDSRYAAPEQDRFQAATPDPVHPAIGAGVSWANVRIYKVVRLQPSNARVAVKLDDGTPLMLDQADGEGRVVTFTSALDNIANDLPLQPIFVAFVQRTAQYLAGLDAAPANYTVGASLDLRASKGSAPAEVLGPDGRRALSLAETRSAASVALTRAGFYDVRLANGRHALAAVNPDRRESDLAVTPAETLALWQGSEPVRRQGPGGAPAEPGRVSLWWYVLWAALLLALAESWVANRYLDTKARPVAAPDLARRNVA